MHLGASIFRACKEGQVTNPLLWIHESEVQEYAGIAFSSCLVHVSAVSVWDSYYCNFFNTNKYGVAIVVVVVIVFIVDLSDLVDIELLPLTSDTFWTWSVCTNCEIISHLTVPEAQR